MEMQKKKSGFSERTVKVLGMVLSIVLFLVIHEAKSQSDYSLPIDSASGKIIYTEVVAVDSTLSKEALFTLAKIWLTKTFRTAGFEIQMEDKEEGVLIGKTEIPLSYKTALAGTHEMQSVLFIFSIYFKDGRYKYEITDFIYQSGASPLVSSFAPDISFENIYFGINSGFYKFKKKLSTNFSTQLDRKIKKIISDFKASMAKKDPYVDSDW